VKHFWPWDYGGLGLLNKRRRDWRRRCAAAFRVLPPEGERGMARERSRTTAALGISGAADEDQLVGKPPAQGGKDPRARSRVRRGGGQARSGGADDFQTIDLREQTIRGGLARLGAQGTNLLVRLGSVMILARLLDPRDFGLVGMVTAFTAFLSWFRDFGLNSAAVQFATVTDEQISALFWINMLLGAVLGLATLAAAPAIAAFYHEPRLFGVTAVLALAFLFNAAGVQHSAMLQRRMHFTTLAVIGLIALIMGTAVAIGAALVGFQYWALVLLSIVSPLAATVGFWVAAGWIPGMPRLRRVVGIRSMIRFGSTMTLNGVIAYIAYNAAQVMIGRFWGAGALGVYTRAYLVVIIPGESLGAVGEVAFSSLSRLQHDRVRLKRYFLKGLSLLLGLTLPVAFAFTLFADDLVFVILGPKWTDAAAIIRLLAPTLVVFTIIQPLGWLLSSIGRVERCLKITVVFAPIMIAACAAGLPHGAKGVAFAYSAVMMCWLVPHILWSVRGTGISFGDVLIAARAPLVAGVAAGAFAVAVRLICGPLVSPFARIVLENGVLLAAFFGLLMMSAGQKSLYLDLLRGLRGRSASYTALGINAARPACRDTQA
jgi:O-antigen/teichoic acid export membrane protein